MHIVEKKQENPKGLVPQVFFNDSLIFVNKPSAEKAASTIIKLHNKNNISISPFFSFDHISGRFIEQYEFDNATKNDYTKREKPDPSFTAGILTTHQLNKKFSLLDGEGSITVGANSGCAISNWSFGSVAADDSYKGSVPTDQFNEGAGPKNYKFSIAKSILIILHSINIEISYSNFISILMNNNRLLYNQESFFVHTIWHRTVIGR